MVDRKVYDFMFLVVAPQFKLFAYYMNSKVVLEQYT